MIGITPAWFTRSGRYCRVPPYTRRPRTCLALCVGMRRWPSVMNTTPATTAQNSTTSRINTSRPCLPEPLPSSRVDSDNNCWAAPGMPAKMPAMMIRLMPLPMPNSSICSPSHIRKIVPDVMIITVTNCQPKLIDSPFMN